MRTVRFYGSFMLFVFGLHFTMQSQMNPPKQRFVLNADYNRFWQNDSTMFVELTTAFYPNLLVLKQDSSGIHGKVELSITIQNKSNGALLYTNRFGVPINLVDSAALVRTGSIVNNTVYALGAGVYTVRLSGCDFFNRSQKDSSAFSVTVQARPDTIAMSDIELCSSITESTDQKDIFYKNTFRVIPNPSCVFGSTSFPLVFTYMEFYNLNTKATYAIKAQIVDSKGDVKKYRSHLRRYTVPHAVDITTLNCTSISSGRYSYEVILSDTLGHEIARSRRPIYLYNPNVQPAQAAPLAVTRTELGGMTLDELAEEFHTAKYITQSEDVKTFEKLTTAEALKEFLEKFWTRVENEEAGRSNLTRATYLQRVLTSNQRYKTFAKVGWRTDQGRVYILYGEPDETQRFPNSGNSKPYEIWNYHQLEGGVEFDFIDLSGFNEYMLVNSTKRGEVQDASWQQLLQ